MYSTALQPAWRSVAWLVARSPLPRYVPAAVAALPHFVTSALSAPWLTAAAGGVTGLAVSPVTRNVRVGLAAVLALMARDVRHRALRVEAENPDKVFAYYMHVWNIFYACYLMLPALSV